MNYLKKLRRVACSWRYCRVSRMHIVTLTHRISVETQKPAMGLGVSKEIAAEQALTQRWKRENPSKRAARQANERKEYQRRRRNTPHAVRLFRQFQASPARLAS
jgi:hypothetical protein